MHLPAWTKAIEASADPDRAGRFLEQLKAADLALVRNAKPEQIRVVVALFSGSQALSELLLTQPRWLFDLSQEELEFPRPKQRLMRQVKDLLASPLKSRSYNEALTTLRTFRRQEMLRIAARDLARLATLPEIVAELSNVADACLGGVLQVCWQQLSERYGTPYHMAPNGQWVPTPFTVLGMGKLGGQELNYSSDVDLLFVYADEGHVFKVPPRKSEPPGKSLANHQFFTRLCEQFIAETTRSTSDGFLFRVDMRLRPEGNAGPLARSLESYANYYAQWGQTWERMMLIKTRCTAGDAELAHEFLETVQSFRYPRSLNERVLREITAMKDRIENEVVKSGELERNVKLGRGGIREVEFVTQMLQVMNAGRTPFLQGHQTLPTLQKLVEYKLLRASEAQSLTEAYIFLREVEHRLQMEGDQQTHTIPTERKARERLARLMGFPTLQAFENAKAGHCNTVRYIYDKLLKTEDPAPANILPGDFENEAAWKKLLAEHSFRDPDKAIRLLKEFVEGPGYVHVSPRTSELARELLPKILGLCPKSKFEHPNRQFGVLSDPDRVVARLDSFIAAYGARAMLYELWVHNSSLFLLLLMLFDRSEFLAEIAIRNPDLVDDLELSGRLRRSKTAEEILKELRHGRADKDQKAWLRLYFRAEFMRIGLRDILGLADFEQNLVELSALADACLQYALEVVTRNNRLKSPPFSIIGMGKLGGQEITYGSDLDVVFVADSKVKNLPALQKMAAELIDLLATRTEGGSVFIVDARLRPDGEKGLLVNTLKAYEDYYRNRAQLWEIQALTRIRAVAGNQAVGQQFESLAAGLTNFSQPSLPLSAYTKEWKQEICRMRQRIEKERTPPGKDHLAIKTGSGGLIDAEFLAQMFCLEHGWREPNTLRSLIRAQECGALQQPESDRLIENYRQLRRIEGILRRWSYEGETELPDDPAPLYRVSVRCGFATVDEFMTAQKRYRAAIRDVYTAVFASGK